MALLHIALREGFESVLVVMNVHGEEVYRKAEVTTRLQIGLADSLELEVAEGPVTVGIELPEKHLAEEIRFELAGTLYLGVSLSPEREVVHQTSATPFGYL